MIQILCMLKTILIMSKNNIIHLIFLFSTINEVDQSYSESTISDHEDEPEDVIQAKEASFNNKPLFNPV